MRNMLFHPKKSGASIKWKYAVGFVEFGGKEGGGGNSLPFLWVLYYVYGI